ncbi:GNAT family N-acetyltransferase [Candidatus Lokiarchaeum ossiferum]|uniref:GNAT family N-acetyltransferase n=1 Tax=Candidatus Lokiarchaeum ossiferum TaxID=2951803 RepID=UPI00352DDB0A
MSAVNNTKFSLRPCTSDDISLVMDVNETTLPENYPLFFYEQILERYPDSFQLAYLEDDPKKIIGYIMWRIERGPSSFGLDYVKKAHLVSLAVLSEFRRIGVANALLERSMEIVTKYNISEYVLEVRVSNAGAIFLYEKLHRFERIRIIGHYYRDGEDAFYMASKYDLNGSYSFGSTGMTDSEIINYYKEKNQGYLCFRCEKCDSLFLKGLGFSFPGSVSPNDSTTLKCAQCENSFKIYEISQGTYDV